MTIVEQTDFKGKFKLTQKTSEFLNELIVEIEPKIMKDLLGIELYEVFRVEYYDQPTFPVSGIWHDLIQGKIYDNTIYGVKIDFEGMKQALIAFIYAEYKLSYNIDTPGGTIDLTDNDNDKSPIQQLNSLYVNAYNRGVNLYIRARNFMVENKDDYTGWVYSGKDFKQ